MSCHKTCFNCQLRWDSFATSCNYETYKTVEWSVKVKRNLKARCIPQHVMQLLSVKYVTALQASGESYMVSSDGHWLVKGWWQIVMPFIVNCCPSWRKTLEEAIKWSWSKHHFFEILLSMKAVLYLRWRRHWGQAGAWLEVMHALYQPTRGLRMFWLPRCIHLHVCMCSDKKINTAVMYISSNLILEICHF